MIDETFFKYMRNFVFDESKEVPLTDIFKLSSETIVEIYKDCEVELPSYVSVLTYGDYFENNVIADKIRKKIIFEWEHNRSAFKVLKKQNLLEYTAGEKAYEAKQLKEAFPEILGARVSGTKIVLNLDESEKFFGIRFKPNLFCF